MSPQARVCATGTDVLGTPKTAPLAQPATILVRMSSWPPLSALAVQLVTAYTPPTVAAESQEGLRARTKG